MSLVIYLGWHVFKSKTDSFLPAEIGSHSFLSLNEAISEMEQEGIVLLETLNNSDKVLNQWLVQNPQRHVTLIWPQPQAFVAACLAQSQDPEPVLKQWQQEAKQVLALFRHHRRQVALIGAAPGEYLEKEIALKFESISAGWLQFQSIFISPIYRLAARQLVDNDIHLRDTLKYLIASSQASTLPTENAGGIVKDALVFFKSLESEFDTHNEVKSELAEIKQKLKNTSQQFDDEQEENKLLLVQLHKAQEAIEDIYLGKNKGQLKSFNLKTNEVVESNDAYQQAIHNQKSLVTWLRAHAYRHASIAYRDSRAYKKTLPKQIALIKKSEYFNSDWYCSKYTDVAKSNIDPAEHYLKFGAIEGRNPSALFNTEFYLVKYPDVATSGQHPLLHYLRYGVNEQRETTSKVSS